MTGAIESELAAAASEAQAQGRVPIAVLDIDLTLVEPGLLTEAETAWLDAYHARVRDSLTPDLDGAAAKWLAHATRPVALAHTTPPVD